MTAAVLQSPLEVILFFTSLISHGVKTQSFETISNSLKNDQYIRQSEDFDEARLSPESLQQLYFTLLKDEVKSQGQKNRSASPTGQENGSPNSRKRKLSSPPLQSLNDAQEYEHLLPILVNKLYARYRDQAINSIKEEEERFKSLHGRLTRLNADSTSTKVNGDATQTQSATAEQTPFRREQQDFAKKDTVSHLLPLHMEKYSATARPLPNLKTSTTPFGVQAVPTEPHQTPVQPIPSTTSAQSSQPTVHAQTQSLPPTVPVTSERVLSVTPGASARQPPRFAAGPTATQPFPTQGSTPAYTAPVFSRQPWPQRGQRHPDPRDSHPTPLSAQSTQGPLHHGNQPLPPPYGHAQAQYAQSPLGQSQTPSHQPAFVQGGFGQTAKPTQFPATPSNQLSLVGQTTPIPSTSARRNLPPIDTSASSTKWKSTGRPREKSPERPKLSPLRIEFDDSGSEADVEGTSMEMRKSHGYDSNRASPTDKEDTPSKAAPTRGRGRGGRPRGSGRAAANRAGSASASTRTRSQSIVSQPDEPMISKREPSRKGEQEPSTPADEQPPLSARSSNAGTPLPVIGRRRGNTLRGVELTPPARGPQKRKRAETPSSVGPATPRFAAPPTKPGYVLAVKHMPKIASTILNDVTTHKLASRFQKPISEREVPGYRDLVFQPQDLKTIRSMLSAGQRMIGLAEEAARDGNGAALQEGPRAGTVWLERTADVLPPRAIVNSSQLETEICRIFANAVMFNPDPKRGIGPTFRARAKRAEALRREKLGRSKGSNDESSSDEDYDDEGGSLVEDAREMFHDVEKQLAGWRAAERTTTNAGDSREGAGESARDESMAEESKDEDEAGATEGEEGRPTRRRRL